MINTLLGLMIKVNIDWNLTTPYMLQEYIGVTQKLLEDLHQCLSGEFKSGLTKEAVESGFNPFERGKVLREPIFYSGEAAYNFQYLDLAVRKYAFDVSWLQKNHGFTIDDVSRVAKAVEDIRAQRFPEIYNHIQKQHPDKRTMLPFFTFTPDKIAVQANLAIDIVERVLGAFELRPTERNVGFNTLHDFNVITATPLLRMPNGEFLSLQSYSLAEAIYESPHHWMYQDEVIVQHSRRTAATLRKLLLPNASAWYLGISLFI